MLPLALRTRMLRQDAILAINLRKKRIALRLPARSLSSSVL